MNPLQKLHQYILQEYADEYTSTVDKHGTRTFHYVRDGYDQLIINRQLKTLTIRIGNQSITKKLEYDL